MVHAPCPERLRAPTASSLHGIATLMHILADAVPPRTAIRQIEALFVIAYAHKMGRSVTLRDVVEAVDEEGGARALERSIHVFTAPSRVYPAALDWVEQVPDPDDRRKRYLRLTAKGDSALAAMFAAMSREGD